MERQSARQLAEDLARLGLAAFLAMADPAGSPPRGASIDERLKDMPEGLDELATSNCARATAAVRPRRWPPEPEPSRAPVHETNLCV